MEVTQHLPTNEQKHNVKDFPGDPASVLVMCQPSLGRTRTFDIPAEVKMFFLVSSSSSVFGFNEMGSKFSV